MKIVHTDQGLRLSGTERFNQAAARIRQQTRAARLRIVFYSGAVVFLLLLVLLWIKT